MFLPHEERPGGEPPPPPIDDGMGLFRALPFILPSGIAFWAYFLSFILPGRASEVACGIGHLSVSVTALVIIISMALNHMAKKLQYLNKWPGA